MSAKAEYKVVIVFEDELRVASRLLRGFFEAGLDLSPDDAVSIIEACHCALQGVDDEDAVICLGRKPVPAAASAPPSSSDEQGKVGKGVTP